MALLVPAFLIFESLSVNGQIKEPRPIVSFQGTMTYAAVNAHNKVELGRQDDLYSLFYIILEFIKGISSILLAEIGSNLATLIQFFANCIFRKPSVESFERKRTNWAP